MDVHLQEVSRRRPEDLKNLIVAGVLAKLEEHPPEELQDRVGRDIWNAIITIMIYLPSKQPSSITRKKRKRTRLPRFTSGNRTFNQNPADDLSSYWRELSDSLQILLLGGALSADSARLTFTVCAPCKAISSFLYYILSNRRRGFSREESGSVEVHLSMKIPLRFAKRVQEVRV